MPTAIRPGLSPIVRIEQPVGVAGPRQRRLAFMVALVLAAIALGALPFARVPLPPLPAFLPAYLAAVLVLDVLTAALFLIQFAHARVPSLVSLAAAYLFTGLIVVPHILAFPGVFAPAGLFGAGPQSATWLWVFWHGGFPLLIGLHVLRLRAERVELPLVEHAGRSAGLAAVAIGALVLFLAWVAIVHGDALPTIIRRDDYAALIRSGVGPVVFVLNVAALAALWRAAKGGTSNQLWLTLAMLASLLDVTLTLAAGARYSLGWYVARLNSLVCAGLVLGAMLVEIHRIYGRLARLATEDGLTGLANRREFDQRLAAECRRAARGGTPLALVMVDVDHFKAYNDAYGHQGGDECLRQVACALAGCLHRPGDLAARYGGEELAAILPGTGRDGALDVARRMRAAVEALALPHAKSATAPHVTISVGVAAGDTGMAPDAQALIAAADAALYRAKAQGRNRVMMTDAEVPGLAGRDASQRAA